MADEEDGNMKALENEMKNLSLNINAAITRMDRVADLVTANTIAIAKVGTNQDNMTKDIDDLEVKVNGWNSINSVGVVIASTVAAIGTWLRS